MQTARILDSVLMEAEALLKMSVVKEKRLWVDSLKVPDGAVWYELRGGIAPVLEPAAWISVNVGFLALDHMRVFEAGYRQLGYDHMTDLTAGIQGIFEPVLNNIQSAREALHPVAYPDHIRLPEGHPMLALLAEQQVSSQQPNAEASSKPASGRDSSQRRPKPPTSG
jgi:hypothetical protein